MSTCDNLLSSAEAAKILGVSDRTLYTLTKQGKLHPRRLGPKIVKYMASDLQAFIDSLPPADLTRPPRVGS